MLSSAEEHMLEQINDQEIIDFLQTLVQTNSENPPGNEAAVAQLIADKLESFGCTVEKHYVEGDRFNVIAVLEGASPQKMLLNGHTDTVNFGDVTAWDYPPTSGQIHAGRLYGRGSTDMKAGLVAQIFAIKALLDCGVPFEKGLMFTAVIDEEVFFKGTKALLADNKLQDCEIAYVSEPTSLQIADCLKGGIEFKARTYGKSAHAGVAFIGDSAIFKMNKVVTALEAYNSELKARMNVPVLKYPTVNVGRITGGNGVTLVPEFCEIEFDRQVLPSEDIAAAKQEVVDVIKRVEQEHHIQVELETVQSFQTWQVGRNEDVVTRLATASRKLFHKEPDYIGFNGYAEVELLAAHGIPSVLFGPGDIAVAHAPNEYVPLKEVIDATKVYALLAYQYVRGE